MDASVPPLRPPRTCTRCGATEGVQLYIQGYRCPAHTPAAIRGQPEPPSGYCAPNRCYCDDPACPATYIHYE